MAFLISLLIVNLVTLVASFYIMHIEHRPFYIKHQ